MTVPGLSIVVPVYGNWWLTERCLRELERLRDASSTQFETIVVDNASPDETPESIAAFPWVRYVRNETNLNFAGACNAGVRLARAPVALLLNNDAYPIGDALTPLAAAFDRAEVAIAGGALFFEDGVTQAAGLVVLPNAHWHYACRSLPPDLDAVRRSGDALGVSGAAMAVRTRWFVESGGFDESFVNGFEDVDLCLRARERGLAIAYVAGARFAHYEAASAGRFEREAENERRFYARWSASMSALPRTARGEVGAVVVRDASQPDPLLAAALDDLEDALRGFGHPVVRGAIAPWRHLDRRFRHSASLAWFSDEPPAPGVAVMRDARGRAVLRTFGAAALEVAWLPCASADRVARLGARRSDDASCTAVGVAGAGAATCARSKRAAAIRSFASPRSSCWAKSAASSRASCTWASRTRARSATCCSRRADSRRWWTTARTCARSSHPTSRSSRRGPRSARRPAASSRIVALRARFGDLVAADARRRFSPRRSAIRVVDLLCAARFGLERPGRARSDSPL